MKTACTATQLEFHSQISRVVADEFDGGKISSDSGGLLLREVEQRTQILKRLTGCFTDYRDANQIEHSLESLNKQRVMRPALGYEDRDDQDSLRQGSLLALLARISHQAASNTDEALALWRKAWMIKNTVCYSGMPITVQAGLRVRKLALHSNRSHCYAFRSRAAITNTNPAPAPVILVRNAG